MASDLITNSSDAQPARADAEATTGGPGGFGAFGHEGHQGPGEQAEPRPLLRRLKSLEDELRQEGSEAASQKDRVRFETNGAHAKPLSFRKRIKALRKELPLNGTAHAPTAVDEAVFTPGERAKPWSFRKRLKTLEHELGTEGAETPSGGENGATDASGAGEATPDRAFWSVLRTMKEQRHPDEEDAPNGQTSDPEATQAMPEGEASVAEQAGSVPVEDKLVAEAGKAVPAAAPSRQSEAAESKPEGVAPVAEKVGSEPVEDKPVAEAGKATPAAAPNRSEAAESKPETEASVERKEVQSTGSGLNGAHATGAARAPEQPAKPEVAAEPAPNGADKGAEPISKAAAAGSPAPDRAKRARKARTSGAGEASAKPNGKAPAKDQTSTDDQPKPAAKEARTEGKTEAKRSAKTRKPAKREARATGEDGKGSDKARGDGGSASGGAGGDGGGTSQLQKRSGDPNFRDILGRGLAACRRGLMAVGIFSFFVNLLLLSIPIYLFQISDRVLTGRSIDTLLVLTGIVVGALAVHVLLDMVRRVLLLRTATEMECKLGAPVLSAAAKVSHASSNREFQALSDLQQVRSFMTGPVLLQMFDAPIAPVFFLVVFLIHPHLGFIITGAGCALLVIALINQRMTAVPFARANAYSMRANYQADALSRNSQVLNAMGMIREGVLMWGRETAEGLKAQVEGQDRNIVMAGLSKFVRLVTQVAVLGWGANLALNGDLTGGMIIAASIVGSRALAPVEGTIDGWRHFVQARSAYNRIRQLLKSSPLNLERLRLPEPKGRLSVEKILYVPPPTKKVILNGVSFALEPGESLAVVGPSGTGKSTLARILVGSIAPTAGGVRLDKMDLRNWDPRQFGENVGYLPQDVELFPASIKANIARMRDDVSDESIFRAAELAGVHDVIADFPQGYETQIAMDGSPLSGGQKQRIALARAFFGDPRLVVLDEPNSNLDLPGEQALADALVRAKEKEITVVAITQRPSLLRSVDKILMLRDGCIEALGSRDEIIARLTASKKSMSKPALGSGQPVNGSDKEH